MCVLIAAMELDSKIFEARLSPQALPDFDVTLAEPSGRSSFVKT